MEKNYQREIVIAEKSSSEIIEMCKRYWYMENGVFKEKVGEIAKESNLGVNEASKIAREHSYLKIQVKCNCCDSVMEIKALSQTQVNKLIKPNWECDDCVAIRIAEAHKKQEEVKLELLETRKEKFELAVSCESWTNFNRVELNTLLKMFQARPEELIDRLKKLKNKKFWSILYKANQHGLVDLITRGGGFINELFYLSGVREHINTYLESLNNKKTSQNLKAYHSELGFRLVNNRGARSSEEPIYYNDMSVDRDVLIKANTAYAYTVWPRANGDAYIKISLSDNVLKSKNHQRPNGPQHDDDIDDWTY